MYARTVIGPRRTQYPERPRSAARDPTRTTPTDFTASPLHCLVPCASSRDLTRLFFRRLSLSHANAAETLPRRRHWLPEGDGAPHGVRLPRDPRKVIQPESENSSGVTMRSGGNPSALAQILWLAPFLSSARSGRGWHCGLENRAGEGTRTLDIQLGKLALYQLSYARGETVNSLSHSTRECDRGAYPPFYHVQLCQFHASRSGRGYNRTILSR